MSSLSVSQIIASILASVGIGVTPLPQGQGFTAVQHSTPPKLHLTLAFAGDTVLLKEPHYPALEEASATWIRDIFTSADAAMVNIEGVVSDKPLKVRPCGGDVEHCFRFLMPSDAAQTLKALGVTAGNMANNHAMDYQNPGQLETAKQLQAVGIAPFGNLDVPTAVTKTTSGRTIGWIGFAPHEGVLPMRDTDSACLLTKALKARVDIVVVSLHAGAEGAAAATLPQGDEYFLGSWRGNVKAFSHRMVDCGADIVAGHGPHVLRALERYHDRLIIYSLGNFLTPFGLNLRGTQGYGGILKVHVTPEGRFIGGVFYGSLQEKGRAGPTPHTPATLQLQKLTQQAFNGNSGVKITDAGDLLAATPAQ